MVFAASSARTVWDRTARAIFECSVINTRVRAALGPPGSPANWRCIVLSELGEVDVLDEPWRTAPNHSRPASCIGDVDIDADDQPAALDPQKGQ